MCQSLTKGAARSSVGGAKNSACGARPRGSIWVGGCRHSLAPETRPSLDLVGGVPWEGGPSGSAADQAETWTLSPGGVFGGVSQDERTPASLEPPSHCQPRAPTRHVSGSSSSPFGQVGGGAWEGDSQCPRPSPVGCPEATAVFSPRGVPPGCPPPLPGPWGGLGAAALAWARLHPHRVALGPGTLQLVDVVMACLLATRTPLLSPPPQPAPLKLVST